MFAKAVQERGSVHAPNKDVCGLLAYTLRVWHLQTMIGTGASPSVTADLEKQPPFTT